MIHYVNFKKNVTLYNNLYVIILKNDILLTKKNCVKKKYIKI